MVTGTGRARSEAENPYLGIYAPAFDIRHMSRVYRVVWEGNTYQMNLSQRETQSEASGVHSEVPECLEWR